MHKLIAISWHVHNLLVISSRIENLFSSIRLGIWWMLSSFQSYTMHVFDSVLLIAYAVNTSGLPIGDIASGIAYEPGQGPVCSEEGTSEPWKYGKIMMTYLQQVCSSIRYSKFRHYSAYVSSYDDFFRTPLYSRVVAATLLCLLIRTFLRRNGLTSPLSDIYDTCRARCT